jgi:poly(hydroxyalkanoate) granule-associated protein
MSEEVEVQVRQIDDTAENEETPPIVELMRRLLLASIGAVAMTYDEAEKFIARLVDRGELAQKDGEKVLNEVMGRFRQVSASESQNVAEAEKKMESGLENLFGRLNIPSKHDIDDLNARLAQLAARIEELQRKES